MLLYIIDGFNLVHKIPSVKSSDIPQLELIYYIKNNKLTGSRNNKVVIVFDGALQPEAKRDAEFEIVFSGEFSADDLIKARIDKIKNSKYPLSEVIVVSDDREIRDYAKKQGAISERTVDFIKPKGTANRSDSKDISYPLQKEITDELRKIWLKE
ncbi:MAG: NYN domain-containing protein [Candidatus Omnitrophica bacterium]|nr:NYN domain-containing protein [Candidatus Omnitrophota bacterium]